MNPMHFWKSWKDFYRHENESVIFYINGEGRGVNSQNVGVFIYNILN